ncbi:cytokine-dependent hematopoietic cell linker isoform X2 [Pseudorasbora parva]|uniref:cytokine-dependent hematopoietic cell linker isoform X2 n=1 Tax=Pseudorasbora parva TaxID=51549 RepID=UPI00351E75D0
MMDGMNRREQIIRHTHVDEDSCPAERAPRGRISVADVPHRPLRVQPGCKGPPVNRAIKPGRLPKSASAGRLESMGSADRAITVTPRPVRSLPRDHLTLPPLPVSDYPNPFDSSPPSRPAPASPHIRTHHSWMQSSPCHSENVTTTQASASNTSHRFSLDLESQDLDSAYESESSLSDPHLRRTQHHEWPPARGEAHGSFTSHSKPAQGLAEQNWYVGQVGRVEAEHALHLVNREGAFLVRDCSKNTTHEPLVLAVFYDKRVFNIQIRFSEEISKYTLGTGLRTNDRFDSVTDIIKFHSIFPIVLIDGRKTSAATNQKRQCVLMYPITKQDLTELLN